jgi:ketosteroid isomerase-like protein
MPNVMTQNKHAEIVRRGYQAFNAADMKTLTELFDEKATWHTPGKNPMSGDYKGRDAILAHFARLGQETGGTFRAELRHLLADEEGRVVGLNQDTALRNGKRLMLDSCVLFEMKNGRIISGREYVYDQHAADAFFS